MTRISFDDLDNEEVETALSEDTAIAILQRMVDSMRTSDVNTLPLAVRQSESLSLWENSPHDLQPIELGEPRKRAGFQLVFHEKMHAQQLAMGSDADLSPGRNTEDLLRPIPRGVEKVWLKRVIIVSIAIVVFVVVVVLLWPFVLSNVFRHF